jgi:hypothetical protein
MPTVVQVVPGTVTATSPATVTATVTAGNRLVVGFLSDNNFAQGAITGLTDTQSNSYGTAIAAVQVTNACRTEAWECTASASGSVTVSAAYSGTMNAQLVLFEVSGLGAVDKIVTENNASATATTKTLTESGANASATAFVLGLISLSGYDTPSGMSNPGTTGYTSGSFADTGYAKQSSYKVTAGSETSAITWSWSNAQLLSALLITWNSAGGGSSIAAISNYYRMMRGS